MTVGRPGDRRQPGGPGNFDGWCQRMLLYDTHLCHGGSCTLFAFFVGMASFVSHAFVFCLLWRCPRFGADSVQTIGGPSSHPARVLEWTTCFCVCVSIWSLAARKRRFVPASGSDEVCCAPHSRRPSRLPRHKPLATALPLAQSSLHAPRFRVPPTKQRIPMRSEHSEKNATCHCHKRASRI